MEASTLSSAHLSPASPQQNHPDYLPERSSILNVVWGVAILGLLLVTIRTFGLTQAQAGELIRGPHGGNYWLLKLTHIIADNTLPGLFALAAGATILLFLSNPNVAGFPSTQEIFIRRQLWLGVFGVLNAMLFLCSNDLLFPFSVASILLFSLQRLSARAFLIGAILTGLIFSGKSYWNYTEQQEKFAKYKTVVALEKNKKVKLTDEQKADKSTWEGTVKSVAYDKKKDRESTIKMRSDYATVWEYVLPGLQRKHSRQLYQSGIWEILSMMLLGMTLFRWGFFSERFSQRNVVILTIAGLVTGPLLAWFLWPSYEQKIVDFTKVYSTGSLPLSDWLQPLERACSAVGLASLILLFFRAGIGNLLRDSLDAVGQLALTNYVAQTIFCTLFFYGYGMGYFGDLHIYQLYILVFDIWLIQLVFSAVWLRYYKLGPLEWLWQSLSSGVKLPFRRQDQQSVLA
ncbi:DUF418 domain-containing protein [Spirosoma daeguense]